MYNYSNLPPRPGRNINTTVALSHSNNTAAALSRNSKMNPLFLNPLAHFKMRKDKTRSKVLDSYDIIGYIAAGTYGK